MNVWRILYSALLHALVPFALLRLLWRSRHQPAYLRHVAERFGFYASSATPPLIWVHAVSVGETRAAEPLVAALRKHWPEHRILLTHMTPTGRATGEQVYGSGVSRAYIPYDLPWAVGRFLSHYRPQFGLLLETELWPNLIHACHAGSIPLYLVNARLSERSARGYARFASFTRSTLQQLAGVAAQTEADAQRLEALGAVGVAVCGNLKFDRSPRPRDIELGAQLRTRFGNRPVFLAASTREGEEEKVLAAVHLAGLQELLTVIVPRHPQRFDAVARLLADRSLAYQRRSENRAVDSATAIVLGDSMGELYAYYAACDVAFIGGSLVPLGGQNLLEACAVGKAAIVGPHMFNFEEATQFAVQAGAAVQVRDERDLGQVIATLFTDRARRDRMGDSGLLLMRQHQGATQRTLSFLQEGARR